MSHRFAALVLVLGAVLLTASLAALWVGGSDWLVTSAGARRALAAEDLPADARGWFDVAGCVRHDLAVVVTAEGVVYRLGEPGPAADESDRIYTPLSPRAECDEERPPSRVVALVEDREATSTTLGRAAPRLIVPPPIPAMVDGTIGPRVGDQGRARRALKRMRIDLPALGDPPLLKKGGRPAERVLSLLTAGAGIHGLLLFALGARWLRRRAQRHEALRSGAIDDEEEKFFRTETLD